jgi:hypothetical protein
MSNTYIKNIAKSEKIKDRTDFIEVLKDKGMVNQALEVMKLELASTKNRAWIAQWILEQCYGKASQAFDNGVPQMMIKWEDDVEDKVVND